MDNADQKLASSLRTWRIQQFVKFNGSDYDPDDHLGPVSFMSDKTLHRLVDLAHQGAFTSNEQLIRDVDWYYISEHVEILRDIMQRSRPPPVPLPPAPPALPLAPLPAPPANAAVTPLGAILPKVKRVQRCSECQQVGHNSTCWNFRRFFIAHY